MTTEPEKTQDEAQERVAVSSTRLLDCAVQLLKVAACPNCDGCGFTVHETGGCGPDGENDTRECHQEQCQWCDERNQLLSNYEAQSNDDSATPVV